MQKSICPEWGCCCDHGRECCAGGGGNIDHPDGCKHLAGPRLPCGCWQCDTKPVRCWACLFGSGAGGHAL